jgi:hypothetical protein
MSFGKEILFLMIESCGVSLVMSTSIITDITDTAVIA